MTTKPGDQVRVSVLVAVPPEVAFRVFTEDIDAWWRRGPSYRVAGLRRGIMALEPGVGGRLIETFTVESTPTVFEAGRVTTWDPPRRLVFGWRTSNFAADEVTEVDVTFAASPNGTLVTVTHRGWAALRPDHPARHGLETAAFARMKALWWGELMTSMRQFVQNRPST